MRPLRILFISRAFPPIIGGIEKQNYELSTALSESAQVTLIVNTKGKLYLPIFFPIALCQAIWYLRNVDVVLLGDGVLAPLGWFLKKCSTRPVCCIIHGLDITFSSALYQRVWVQFCLPRLDRLFSVGRETIIQAEKRHIPTKLCDWVPNGVNTTTTEATLTAVEENRIQQLKTHSGEEHFHLFTLGRLVKRKGVSWFVQKIMPQLPHSIHYWIAGEGEARSEIENYVEKMGLQDRVTLLGAVSDAEKQALFKTADLFVQPNIKVENDIEGFGLVVLEAGLAGLAVVASDLEGLKDAIHHEKNGLLIESESVDAYVTVIKEFSSENKKANELGAKARQYNIQHCSWRNVGLKYIEKIEILLTEKSKDERG